MPYPFEFQLESIEACNKTIADNYGNDYYHSHTGMRIKMERKSLGLLASKYYYPTATFAILSLISFLIDPDVVSIYMINQIISIICLSEPALVQLPKDASRYGRSTSGRFF